MRFRRWPLIVGFILVGAATSPPVVGHAQALGEPDRGSPGDEMIQEYLKRAGFAKIETGLDGLFVAVWGEKPKGS